MYFGEIHPPMMRRMYFSTSLRFFGVLFDVRRLTFSTFGAPHRLRDQIRTESLEREIGASVRSLWK